MKKFFRKKLPLKKIPLALKVLILTLLTSGAVWLVLDHFQTIKLRDLFIAKLAEDLQIHAKQDREYFDKHIQKIHQAAKLITAQYDFQSYVFNTGWSQNKDIKYHTEIPTWLPSSSTLRAFFNARYALLINEKAQVCEVYLNAPEYPPEILLKPSNLLQKLSHAQSFMTDIQGFPHVLSSESIKDSTENTVATLMLVSPIDSDFLMASQTDMHLETIIALLTGNAQKILASSNPDLLVEGAFVTDFEDKFLMTGTSSFLDYGASTLTLQFASFIDTERAYHVADYMSAESHKQKAILVLILISIFVMLTLWITQRIRRMTRRITTFLEKRLGIETLKIGDEINEIVSSFKQLQKGIERSIAQANMIAAGVYDHEVQLLSEHDPLGLALSDMTDALRKSEIKNIAQDWLKTGQMKLNDRMRGEQELIDLSKNILAFLVNYLPAQMALIYLIELDERHLSFLRLTASYHYTHRKNLDNRFYFGEGLVGQAALEQQAILVTDDVEEFIRFESNGKNVVIQNIIAIPFSYENKVKGVIKLGSVDKLTTTQLEFLELAMTNIGIAVNTAESREKMRALLDKTQMQSQELRIQKEELQTQAEELQAQAEELQTQTVELQTQQEQLRQTNEDLNEYTKQLEHQKQEIYDKNAALEKTQVAVEVKAKELELASRYKSEFLANMSHELRTPLNSILILAQLLSKNTQANLTEKQVEYAKTIFQSGSDLLVLINEVLDLSKVEAGKIEVHIENLPLVDLAERIEHKFRSIAEQKGLAFQISIAKNLPVTIQTDTQRLQQILNNLLSNAFKFTASGEVKLMIQRPIPSSEFAGLDIGKTVAFSVIDTGVGIPEHKKESIFEAFRQADGTTSRKFGGTGLGLTITRQLARVLGGDIKVRSEVGKGSIFTFYLPETQEHYGIPEIQPSIPEVSALTSFTQTKQKNKKANVDDKNNIKPEDKSILIIENDPKFSGVLLELAREKGFKAIVAENGQKGLQFVKQYFPKAIMLDVGLPSIDGWTVMERLKDDPETRHIPVHFIAASGQVLVARKMGAIGYLFKPSTIDKLREAFDTIDQFIAQRQKNLLIIAYNQTHANDIINIVSMKNVNIVTEKTFTAAFEKLQTLSFDCIIFDVNVKDCSSVDFLKQEKTKKQLSNIPVIVYLSRELTKEEDVLWQQCNADLALKTVRSPERLLDETTLFLHQSEADLPQEKRKMLRRVHDKEAIFKGKRVLLVDDDARNVFALATVLEDKNMDVVISKNGQEALDSLAKESDISIILMDIMMPEMDGYEAIQRIRAHEKFRKLPIIALTAKAMKGDKAKCIEAGANDYLSKPVDTDKLMSLMRIWLYQ